MQYNTLPKHAAHTHDHKTRKLLKRICFFLGSGHGKLAKPAHQKALEHSEGELRGAFLASYSVLRDLAQRFSQTNNAEELQAALRALQLHLSTCVAICTDSQYVFFFLPRPG